MCLWCPAVAPDGQEIRWDVIGLISVRVRPSELELQLQPHYLFVVEWVLLVLPAFTIPPSIDAPPVGSAMRTIPNEAPSEARAAQTPSHLTHPHTPEDNPQNLWQVP